MKAISQLWTNRIISGDKSYDQVPPKLKDEVAECLKNVGHEELINKQPSTKKG